MNVVELQASLEWEVCYGELIFDPDDPTIEVGAEVRLSGIAERMQEELVFDLFELIESFHNPGLYYPMNCICGYPDHARINKPAHVQHPCSETIAWEVETQAWSGVLDNERLGSAAILKWVFEREGYRRAINTMQAELISHCKHLRPDVYRRYCARKQYGDDAPCIDTLMVEYLQPVTDGNTLERLYQLPVPALPKQSLEGDIALA